jgi:hypothetical protein
LWIKEPAIIASRRFNGLNSILAGRGVMEEEKALGRTIISTERTTI